MIFGIGTDFVEVSRVEKLINSFGEKFLNRVYTEYEISKAPIDIVKQNKYYAKRFAAKEAFSKALGLGIGEMVAFKDIEVRNDDAGKPYIELKTTKIAPSLKAHLTLSDDEKYALAFVVIEKND